MRVQLLIILDTQLAQLAFLYLQSTLHTLTKFIKVGEVLGFLFLKVL